MAEGFPLGKGARPQSSHEPRSLEAALVDVVFRGLAGVLGKLAFEVVALPSRLGRFGVQAHDALVKFCPVFFPSVVLIAQFRVTRHGADHRLDVGQRLVLDQGDEAEGLTLFKPHLAGPGEYPVHGEGKG